jgi:hypothetical protein
MGLQSAENEVKTDQRVVFHLTTARRFPAGITARRTENSFLIL